MAAPGGSGLYDVPDVERAKNSRQSNADGTSSRDLEFHAAAARPHAQYRLKARLNIARAEWSQPQPPKFDRGDFHEGCGSPSAEGNGSRLVSPSSRR